jgi:hypothetical protein
MARRWRNQRSRTADRWAAGVIWGFIGFLLVLGIGVVLDTSGAVLPWLGAAVLAGVVLGLWMDRRWVSSHPED